MTNHVTAKCFGRAMDEHPKLIILNKISGLSGHRMESLVAVLALTVKIGKSCSFQGSSSGSQAKS